MAGGVYNPFGFGVAAAPAAVPRRMPQDIPAAPFGFMVPSKWDRVKQALWESNLNAPIRGAYELMNADPYTLYTDTGAAGQQAAADSFDAGTGVMVGSMPAPKPADALTMGIKAYHGSPHSFDKFEWSPRTRGTGEGAQAYGAGLYFAENEGVAKGYRDALGNAAETKLDGAPVADIASASYKKPSGAVTPEEQIADIVSSYGTLNAARMTISNRYPHLMGKFDELVNSGRLTPGGSMYEVSINADPNAFLDYDKPLTEQSQQVRDALRKHYGFTYGSKEQQGWTGKDVAEISAMQPEHVQELTKAGIPGIRYLDAGSRGAGDGSRNYVVFDDKLISIVRKYGIAGASAMFGYNILDGLTDAQAAELKKADGK